MFSFLFSHVAVERRGKKAIFSQVIWQATFKMFYLLSVGVVVPVGVHIVSFCRHNNHDSHLPTVLI